MAVGELMTERSTRRISLPLLSADAVNRLTRSTGIEPTELYRLTGGNPFYVTEVLESGDGTVPLTASEAVLARVARLSSEARRVLDVAAVIGSRVELRVLRQVAGSDCEAIDECLDQDARFRSRGFAFPARDRADGRRGSVAGASPPDLHGRILDVLRAGIEDDARLAHHAEGAGDREAVLQYAPLAAQRASELAAHREAAAQYERALRFADRLEPAECTPSTTGSASKRR